MLDSRPVELCLHTSDTLERSTGAPETTTDIALHVFVGHDDQILISVVGEGGWNAMIQDEPLTGRPIQRIIGSGEMYQKETGEIIIVIA